MICYNRSLKEEKDSLFLNNNPFLYLDNLRFSKNSCYLSTKHPKRNNPIPYLDKSLHIFFIVLK